MGQVSDKCSCLFKKNDQSMVVFENNSDSNTNIARDKDNNTFNDNFLKSKKTNSIKTLETVKSPMIQFLKLNEEVQMGGRLQNVKNIDKTILISIFQAYIKGYLFRKNYKYYKKLQIDETEKIIERYHNLYNTSALIRAESNIKFQFTKNGWKKFYDENTYVYYDYYKKFNDNKELLLTTKINIFREQAFYCGNINMKGVKHGFGYMVTKKGEKFQGQWIDGNFTGWGRYISSSGTVFEGLFVKGLLNGKGIRISLSGSYYEGEFMNGLKNGEGKEETNEHIYTGQFMNDKKEGSGKLMYKYKTDTYEGEFTSDSITGYGFYRWANEDTYEGTFIKGKMHGRGIYKWLDGAEYHGSYTNNIKEGSGRFKWPDGKIFEGPFINGKPHGLGKLYSVNIIQEVEFNEGKRIRTLSEKPNTST
jgi:hypothetical protein